MSITIEHSDTAMRATFYNMEEGAHYVLNDFWFEETNRVRKEYNHFLLEDKGEYKFTRKGDDLFINNRFVFNFTGKSNIIFAFAFAFAAALVTTLAELVDDAVAVGVDLVLALALQHNGFEKMKSDTCDGKLVEIDGKKYKLTAV